MVPLYSGGVVLRDSLDIFNHATLEKIYVRNDWENSISVYYCHHVDSLYNIVHSIAIW